MSESSSAVTSDDEEDKAPLLPKHNLAEYVPESAEDFDDSVVLRTKLVADALQSGLMCESKSAEDVIEDLAGKMNPGTWVLEKGDYIVEEGQKPLRWFVIKSGRVKFRSEDGRINKTLAAGMSFGEVGIIYQCPHVATARALTETELLVLDLPVSHTGQKSKRKGPFHYLTQPGSEVGRFLKMAPLFGNNITKAEHFRFLMDNLSMVRFKPNELIQREGKKAKHWYVVYKGHVETFEQEFHKKRRGKVIGLRRKGKKAVGQHFGAKSWFLGSEDGEWFSARAGADGADLLRWTYPSVASPDHMTYTTILKGIPGVQDDEEPEPAVNLSELANKKKKDAKKQALLVPDRIAEQAIATAKHHEKFKMFGNADPDLDDRHGRRDNRLSKADRKELTILKRQFEDRSYTWKTQLGKKVFDNLTYEAFLGEGSYGVVSLMFHEKSGTQLARKALGIDKIDSTEKWRQIMWEWKVMTLLESPFCVKLLGFERDDKHLYFYQEPIRGGDFFDLLADRGQLFEREARFYAACVVMAFQHLHKFSVVFRDLKPENLLVDTNGYLKLCDFGFAKIVHNLTYSTYGTPEYMSPEMIQRTGVNSAHDWWTVGVFIYEMLDGFSPFYTAETEAWKLRAKILKGKYDMRDYWSTEVQDLIKGLLDPDPTCRFGFSKLAGMGIRSQPWFKDVDWDGMQDLSVESPKKFPIKNKHDVSHANRTGMTEVFVANNVIC